MIINTETQIRIKKIECDTILKATNLQMGRPYVPYEGSYVFTPSLSQQTIEIEDMTARHDIIIEPMPLGSATTPTTSAVANPSIGVDDNGLITASVSESFGVTPVVEEGYVINGTEGTVTVSGGSTKQLTTKEGTTITPTESVQTAVEENVYTLGEITVAAIPSDYVGSGIPKKSASDLTASGATVSVPSGFYEENSSKSVQSGTAGTPTATKGAVSNHSVSVTPSVTNTEGYISGSTKTGTPVTVSASELVSGTKTITENGENIDVVNYEDVTVNVEGSSVNLESGSATISGAGTVEHTPGVGYDGFDTFTTTTPSASSSLGTSAYYDFDGGNASWNLNHYIDVGSAGWVASGRTYGNTVHYGAVQSGTTITPSESSQTIGGANYMMEGAVTVAAMPSGTAGTPTATKGAVSNHSVSVTPSVTNTTGYITGSTKAGTAVTVSASELVSGSETKTTNGTYDVTNLAELVVDVQSGGSIAVDYKEASGTNTSSIAFTGLSGQPTSFVIFSTTSLSTGTPSKVATVVYDGTSTFADTITNTSNAQVTYVGNGFSFSYANGTLTVTSAGESFTADSYVLAYTYGGNSVSTKDVQVGSGATSITFTGLEGVPLYWSCAFKSNFSTSSGYQRAITILNVAGATVGFAMDSGANYSGSYWTSSYSNGTLTITSQSANAGGYFHQPGYYQLTYAVDSSAPQYQTKTVSPTTSQQTVTPDVGYDALEEVIVNAMPTMTLPSATSATSSGTSKATITPSSSAQYLNIPTGYNGTAQYYTISASGGGSSKNVQVLQSTIRSNSTSFVKVLGDLTVSKTGTYDIYWSGGRTNTTSGYTWGTQLYVDGTGYGSENTTWTNNIQSNHLSNVSLTANQKLSVYSRGRSGSSYYSFVPMLVIIEA